MFVALLIVLLTWSDAPAEECAGLAEHSDRLFAAHFVDWPIAFNGIGEEQSQPFLEIARTARLARACLEQDDISLGLYYHEAYAHFTLGRDEEAFSLLAAFFARYDGNTNSLWVPFLYQFRAFAHMRRGEFAEAFSDYGQALVLSESRTPATRAELLLETGTAFLAAHDIASAISAFDRADRLLSEAGQTERSAALRFRSTYQRADALLDWAEYAVEGGADSTARAASLLQTVIKKPPSNLPPLARANAYMILALALGNLGRNAEAMEHIEVAERVALNDNLASEVRAEIARRRARLLMFEGRYTKAQNELASALRLVSGEQAFFGTQWRVLMDLGMLAEASGRLEAAEAAYGEAVRQVEEQAAVSGGSRWTARSYSSWHEGAHRALIRVLLKEGRKAEAFTLLEASRGHYLAALRQEAAQMGNLPPEARSRLAELNERLRIVRNGLLIADNAGRPADLQLLGLEATLVDERNALFRPVELPALDLQRVQASLGDRVLLSYFIDGGYDRMQIEARSHVFVVRADTFAAVPLPQTSMKVIRQLLERTSPALLSGQGTLSQRRFNLKALHQMYELLIAPAAHLLGDAPLVIVPDGPLFYVPMAALLEEEPDAGKVSAPAYLVRRHAISYENAAALVFRRSTRPSPDKRLQAAIVGKTTFEDQGATMRSVSYSADSRNALFPLPHVADEFAAFTRLFRTAQAALDEEATEGAFLRILDTNPSLIHVASHVQFDPLSWGGSSIVLTPDASGSDGRVFMHELLGRSLDADLVVLSGCNTARGPLWTGEGVLGLRFAFDALGARSTLATLWLVSDRSTATLMQSFYRFLRAGLPKDEALQRAQLAYLENAPEAAASAFYWAAPVLYGDVAPLPIARNGLSAAWMFAWGLAAIATFMTVFFIRSRRFKRPSGIQSH